MACMVSALLLLCQSAIAAHACVLAVPDRGDSAAHQPCHDAVAESGNTADSDFCQKHCVSQQAMPAAAKIAAIDMAALPMFPARRDPLLLPAYATPAAMPLTAAPAQSPPLSILHCRLRN
ncbi:MAG TPA: hypothetical protein VLT92_19565 [Burkholderiales bacterium]|nr:hypothetical protein [Burkholderiales bacterium]